MPRPRVLLGSSASKVILIRKPKSTPMIPTLLNLSKVTIIDSTWTLPPYILVSHLSFREQWILQLIAAYISCRSISSWSGQLFTLIYRHKLRLSLWCSFTIILVTDPEAFTQMVLIEITGYPIVSRRGFISIIISPLSVKEALVPFT